MEPGYLQKIVISNLKKIITFLGISSLSKLAKLLSIKEETIKSWFSYRRTPSLKTLDEVSNKLNIPTYILFQENDLIDGCFFDKNIVNNSSQALKNNLKNEYLKRGKISWSEVSSIYSGYFSIDTLKSYHRKRDAIVPPLKTLEVMSSYLGIPVSDLIKEEENEENR